MTKCNRKYHKISILTIKSPIHNNSILLFNCQVIFYYNVGLAIKNRFLN